MTTICEKLKMAVLVVVIILTIITVIEFIAFIIKSLVVIGALATATGLYHCYKMAKDFLNKE